MRAEVHLIGKPVELRMADGDASIVRVSRGAAL